VCYRNPHQLLEQILPQPLPRNARGHTPLDDFDHFCAYTGLDEEHAGPEAVAWTKLAYVSKWVDQHGANRGD
jgi:hypothetical protein